MKRLLGFALVLTLSATGAWAEMYDDCVQFKELDRTIRGCTQIIERGEQESKEYKARLYSNRGVAYERKGDYDRAIADHTKAIDMNPSYATAYINRGIAYDEKGELDRAFADYDKAIALAPKDAVAYSNRSVAYEKKGEVDRAITDFDTLARLAGRWTGKGVMTLSSGPAWNFKCIVTYRSNKDGADMKQNLRCKGRGIQLDAATLLWVDGTQVTGRWEDKINSLNGIVRGIVTNDGFEVMLGGRFLAAKMAVAASTCEQMVTVSPRRSAYFRKLSAELRKC